MLIYCRFIIGFQYLITN